jgi:FkbM family methyltransferase
VNLLSTLRKAVRRAVHVDVQRANPFTLPFTRLVETLKQRDVNTVVDVGANEGGFATDLFDAGYTGQIISFEPLPDAWGALNRRAARYGSRWTIGPRVALSDQAGNAKFHVAGNSQSSSLLPMMSGHEEADPTSRIVSTITVETARLDSLLEPLGVSGPAFLKIDVQGAESLVLAGAPNSLRDRIVGVQMEMSLATLYEGQARADDLTQVLAAAGFRLWDIIPVFRDPRTFQLLQYDGVFYR